MALFNRVFGILLSFLVVLCTKLLLEDPSLVGQASSPAEAFSSPRSLKLCCDPGEVCPPAADCQFSVDSYFCSGLKQVPGQPTINCLAFGDGQVLPELCLLRGKRGAAGAAAEGERGEGSPVRGGRSGRAAGDYGAPGQGPRGGAGGRAAASTGAAVSSPTRSSADGWHASIGLLDESSYYDLSMRCGAGEISPTRYYVAQLWVRLAEVKLQAVAWLFVTVLLMLAYKRTSPARGRNGKLNAVRRAVLVIAGGLICVNVFLYASLGIVAPELYRRLLGGAIVGACLPNFLELLYLLVTRVGHMCADSVMLDDIQYIVNGGAAEGHDD